MRLERLEIAGFKSFSEPVTAEFPEQITVIVGPNGSGKSNIVDAIRWVLGEQSAAGLRCSRMDELIFSGSENRRRLSLAEVQAEFREPGGEGLTISRRIDRSGRGEYLINGRRCRLRDVQEIFFDTGLGRGSYAIIGQGEVERIIDARGDEIRSYLEEVAGVSRYRVMMRETERALVDSEERLGRYSDMLNLRLEYLEPLREQARRARLHRILSGRERDLRRTLVLEELRVAAEKLAENQGRDAGMEAELTELSCREDRVRGQYSQLSTDVDEVNGWINLLERGQRGLYEQRSEAGTRTAVVGERLSSLSETKGRAGRALHDVRQRLREHAGDAEEDPPTAEVESRLEELQGGLQALEARVTEASARLQRAEDIVRRSLQIEGELKLRERDTERQMSAAERELGDCFGQIARDGDELRELEAEGQDQRSSSAEEMARELEQIDEELAAARAQLKSQELQRDEQRRKLEVVSDRLARWEGRMEALREVTGEETAATADLSQGDASFLSRIGVPPGWEGALELALGQWLGAEVAALEDVEGATKGSLILTDIMAELPDGDGIDRPSWKTWLLENGWGDSVMGWLDDLVDFGDRHSERAGRHFCSRFLVVERRETLLGLAGEIWSDRLRGAPGEIPGGLLPCIVTPGGDLADLAGALSVDGRWSPGGAEQTVSPVDVGREIRRLSIGLRDCRAELAEARSLAESAEHQWQEQLQRVRELEEKRRQLAASLEGRRREQKISERQTQRIEDLREQRKNLTERATQLERDKAHMERNLSRLAEARSNLLRHRRRWAATVERRREQLGELEGEAEQARYEQITLRERISAAKRRTEQLLRERTHLDRQQSRWVETIKECRDKIRSAEVERDALNQRVRGLDEALERTRLRLEEARGRHRRASSELKGVRRDLSNLQRRRGQVEKALNSVRVAGVRAQTEFDSTCRRAEEMGIEPASVQLEGENMSDAERARSRRSLSDLEGRRRQLEPVNSLAPEEFRREKAQVDQMREQRRDLFESLQGLRHLFGEIEDRLNARYLRTLRGTSAAFSRTFADLFGGGQAEILTRGADPREAEVEIRVQPPGKRLTRLSLLSGGERALSGIAFLFALQKMRPSPVCVFDEIDAALDDVNTDRFVRYVERQVDGIQYLLVTHQKKTMEVADTLHGVTMSEPGVSELVSVRLEDTDLDSEQGGSR